MKLRKTLAAVFAAALMAAAASAAYAAEVTVGTDGSYATFEALMAAVGQGDAALAQGDTIKVVSDVEVGEVITIPDGYDLNLNLNGHTVTSNLGKNGRPFFVYGKLAVDGNGAMIGDSWGVFDVKDGGELTLKSGKYMAPGYNYDEGYQGNKKDDTGARATIRGQVGSTVTVADGVYAFSRYGAAIYCSGNLTAGACTFESRSSNAEYSADGKDSLFAYCAQGLGKSEFNGTTVHGIQGGLYIGGNGTINGGKYYTDDFSAGSIEPNDYTNSFPAKTIEKWKVFYALYVSNGATFTINDGEFSSDNSSGYCAYNSDNDSGMELGNPLIINGGTFKNRVGTMGADKMYGYIINGGTFKDVTNVADALASGKMLDENGTVVDIPPVELTDAKPFIDTAAPEEEAGRYFEVTTAANNKAAEASFTDGIKTISKTLDLSAIEGSGEVAFSILLLNAPANVTGTITYK